jgi:hypothetical protein
MQKPQQLRLSDVEAAAEEYAKARDTLKDLLNQMVAELDAVRAKYMPDIRRLMSGVANWRALLKQTIEAAPYLFQKPRTFTFFGTEVGFRKQKGKLEWDDDATVVKLIKKHQPEDVQAVLIKVTEKPMKTALSKLPAVDLKKLGINVTADNDAIVIKPVDEIVEQMIAKLVEDATEAVEAAAQAEAA